MVKITPNIDSASVRGASKTKTGAGTKSVSSVQMDSADIAGIPAVELTPRVRLAIAELMKEVATLRSELSQTRKRIGELEKLADSDPLLGILNRRAFVAELDRAIAVVARYQIPSSLLFIDLDGLKAINDKFGHAGGDKALEAVSTSLVSQLRQTDVLGRLGGDEIAVLLTHTSKPEALQKAALIRQKIAALEVMLGDQLIPMGVSIGVAEIGSEMTAELALEYADKQMYQQKASNAAR